MPADNTVSVFSVNGNSAGITLLAVSPTAATRPTSLAYLNGILYVTNQQGAHELGAYHVGSDGKPTQIGQYAVVQQDALPTQVTVSPDGKYVVVNGF
jgi:6-phosphogluconolactonase